MKAQGRVHKYGDNVDTDVIIPARYLNTADHKELAAHCMEDIDKEFIKKVRPGDILVGGFNFGCGSSREHAPQSLWHYGFRAIVAQSFAEIFFGNATTIGIPCVCASAGDIAKIGELIEADPEAPVEVNLGDMTVSCGDFSCKCSMPENARASLVSGTWDPIAGLIDAEAEIAATASKLPYFK